MSPKVRKTALAWMIALSASLASPVRASAADFLSAPVQLQTFKTHSRLAIRLDDGVETDYRAVPGGFELLLKGVALIDLGAPLGAEAQWANERLRVSDSRLASVSVKETPRGVVFAGTWKTARGPEAPADKGMETFEYRQAQPARYVIDFWPKGGPTEAQVKVRKVADARAASMREAEAKAREAQARRIAQEKARQEKADLGRYCRQPLTDQNDVVLPFFPARERVAYERYFPTTMPDAAFEYHVPPAEPVREGAGTPDSQYARLAVELYRKSKYALVLRTLEFFEKEHPASSYRHEMRFLKANTLIRLDRNDEAQALLLGLIVDARDHSVALHSAMYLAGKQVAADQNLQALESFLWLQTHHSNHRLAWLFHLGAGEVLYALKQTERAAKEYEWVTENGATSEIRAQGAFRIGDLYLRRGQFDQALAAYYRAITRFPKEVSGYPVVALNRAESMFWLGEEKSAEKAFEEFLAKYRGHPQGWRATYRLGEIVHRRETGNSESARSWYVQTINGYPYSPAATLARMRLMVCGDHGGFTSASARKFFDEEASRFQAGDEVDSTHYSDFLDWNRVRGLHALKDSRGAMDAALNSIRLNPESLRFRELVDAFYSAMRDTVLALLRDGKKFEALNLYEDRFAKLPNQARDLVTPESDYLFALSRAAADLGLPMVSEKLGIRASGGAGPLTASGRSPASGSPSDSRQESVSERAYGQAKALWLAKGAAEASKLRALLTDVSDDSEFAYGRELILGQLDEKEDRLASALAHASKAQLLLPRSGAQSSEEAATVQYWIARLQYRAEENRAAVESFRAVAKFGKPAPGSSQNLARTLGLAPIPALSALLIDEGELLGRLGAWGEASDAYGRAFDAGGGNRALYEQARASMRAGDDPRAKLLLKRLAASETEDFWKKLAKEALANRETAGKFN